MHTQVARQFADMHDTPVRMLAKGVLRGVVPWAESRRFFAARLKCRLEEETLISHIRAASGNQPVFRLVQELLIWCYDTVNTDPRERD